MPETLLLILKRYAFQCIIGNLKSFGDLSSKIGNNPLTSTPLFKNQQNTSLGYPEVTLHPIQSSNSHVQNQKHSKDNIQPEISHTSSLLHGILTKVKFNRMNRSGIAFVTKTFYRAHVKKDRRQ